MSLVVAVAVRLRLPESSRMPFFIIVHSLCLGMVLMLLARSCAEPKRGKLDASMPAERLWRGELLSRSVARNDPPSEGLAAQHDRTDARR